MSQLRKRTSLQTFRNFALDVGIGYMTELLPYTQEQLQFCRALPKIELHAHLNGSIRDSTIMYELVAPLPRLLGSKNGCDLLCVQRIGREARP